jgi:CelD/BcsL family acetyltransferase involved in cellulose biosynthesis
MADFGITARPKIAMVPGVYARGHEKTVARRRRPADRSKGNPLITLAAAGVVANLTYQEVTLDIFTNMEELEQVWSRFERRAHATFYQSWLWCRAWMETIGKARGVIPRIIVASDGRNDVAFILPLQIRSHSGLKVLEWLGTPHNTYGHGLFEPAFLPPAQDWFRNNWARIVKLAGPVDAILLSEMPASLANHAHPMRGLFNLAGPNRSYRMALAPEYDSLLENKRSAETRRLYRKRERAIAAQGELTFGLPQDKAGLHATLAIMFAQQESRLAEHGVHGVFGRTERDFIYRLADLQDASNPVLLPYTLKFRGEIQAVMLGGVYGNTYWALISSLSATDLRKYSPGDLALRRTIEASCTAGLTSFDFATGDTGYKLHWADEAVELYALLAAVNLRGLIWAASMGAGMTLKRLIKQWPTSRHLFGGLRKAVLGTPFRRSRISD